jgi:hypothetical protein
VLVCAEPAQPRGALASEQAGAEPAQPRGAPVPEQVPVRERVPVRAVRRRAPRMAQPPALAMTRERVLALALVRVH